MRAVAGPITLCGPYSGIACGQGSGIFRPDYHGMGLACKQVMIRWQFQVYTYIHMIWVLEIAESHPSKKAPSFQCEKGPMILNFPLL